MSDMPELATYTNDAAVFIRITGEISLYHTEMLKKKVQRIIAKHADRRLFCFNIAGVSYVDSSGIGFITVIAKELAREEKKLTLCCVNSDIKALFELVQLGKFIPMFENDSDVA